MNRPRHAAIGLAAVLAQAILPGCRIEVDDGRDRHLKIVGRVTYRGGPVKRGTIHLLPIAPTGPPASGAIVDGEIKDVYTRTPGDGVGPGRYRVAITAFDEAFVETVAKRGTDGPDPAEVARGAERIRNLIPARYSNARDSGLTAEFSPGNQSLRLDLVD